MPRILTNMRVTILAAVLALGLILGARHMDVDLIQVNAKILYGIEQNEVDDIVGGLAFVFIGLVIDRARWRARHQREIEAQKLQTLQATMRTVNDIVNNFLNNLLLFEMKVKDVAPPHSLDELEALTFETFEKLKALGNVPIVIEKPLAIGAGIKYEER